MKRFLILMLGLGLGSVACSDDSAGAGGGSNVDIETSLRHLCEKAIGCGCDIPITDQTKCEAQLRAGWKGEWASSEAKGLSRNASCTAEWFAYYESLDCNTRSGDIKSPDCQSWYGSLAEGDVCVGGNDCGLGLECLPNDDRGTVDRTCRPLGEIGDACTGGWDCTYGTRCDGAKCAELPAVGELCHEGGCADGAICRNNDCIAQVGVGGACSSHDECAEGTHCDAPTCAADLPAGASCDPNDYYACATFCHETTLTCGVYALSVCNIVGDSME